MTTATLVRMPTLAEVREHRLLPLISARIEIPESCVCGGVGTCVRCAVDDEAAFKRGQDQ
jgi:hypothetical protein